MPDRAHDDLSTIPVYRARLPRAATVMPYLQRMDAVTTYSNRGPLVHEFEARVHEMLGLCDVGIVTAASGTAAIHAAILAAAGRATPARPLALVPGYTFAATAHAAQACGYEPVFVDVEPSNWCLSAATLRGHPALDRAGIVLPVAPYGKAYDQAEWSSFRDATGIPVVIDGAGAFEAMRRNPAALAGRVPVALSFHATKTFSTGEGGAVVWSDQEGLLRVAQLCNFGMTGARQVCLPGFNGKLSEYHAAVGLASLDATAEIEAERRLRERRFVHAARRVGLFGSIVTWPRIASNYALWVAPTRHAAALGCAALTAADVEWRRWYGSGLHLEAYFAGSHQPALPVVEDVAARLIGIPCFAHMPANAIERIFSALRSALGHYDDLTAAATPRASGIP